MVEPERAPVLILTGPPGAGKTTTARILAGQYARAVHVESDCFFRFISAGFVEPWKPESASQNGVVMSVVAEAASAYARADYFTVIDGIVLPRHFLRPIYEGLHAQGLVVAYVVLRASLDTCLRRANEREAHRLSTRSAIEDLWWQFADLGDLEGHVIETDESGADATALQIGTDMGGRFLLDPSKLPA